MDSHIINSDEHLCLLCRNSAADKTGSHIIPSFIMKRVNGNGVRDHEIGFEIKNGIVESYFGRDIYEDQRRAITDDIEKLESRKNLDVKDFIFCNSCEKYFSSLENAYAKSLSLNLLDNTMTINRKVSPSTALLFWCSIVWRASVTGHLGQRLSAEYEERLRIALAANDISSLNVKYALYRCKDYGRNGRRGTSVCIDIKDSNLLLIADDYMLIMMFDAKDGYQRVQLMDIDMELAINKLNDGVKDEEISSIPTKIYDLVLDSVMRRVIGSMQLPLKLNKMHEAIFGDHIPETVLSETISLLQSSPRKLGDRYSIEHYAWCYKEALIKHGFILDNSDGTYTKVNGKNPIR